MNLALSDEQVFLREAARGALVARQDDRGRPRGARRRGALPDLWPTAVRGRLAGPADRRGARRRRARRVRRDARARRVRPRARAACRCSATCRRRRSSTPRGRRRALEALAAGERARRVRCPRARPATSTPRLDRRRRAAALRARRAGARRSTATASRHAARVALGARRARRRPARRRRRDGDGKPVARRDRGRRDGVSVEAVDALRRDPLARPRDARRRAGDACSTSAPSSSPRAWYLAQALIAAESLGAVETALEVSVAYAKERFTFGRAIGSYQAVKHALTEVLRQLENGRSLLYYAGWARDDAPGRVPARGERRALGRRRARSTTPRAR